jgi:hypothetical protein
VDLQHQDKDLLVVVDKVQVLQAVVVALVQLVLMDFMVAVAVVVQDLVHIQVGVARQALDTMLAELIFMLAVAVAVLLIILLVMVAQAAVVLARKMLLLMVILGVELLQLLQMLKQILVAVAVVGVV